jgi:hypothetical protein
MRYKKIQEEVQLVFLKSFGKWKKGDKIISSVWIGENDQKNTFL